MEKIKYGLVYYPLFFWMKLHSLLPFSLLYILSDILYGLVYWVIGYRKKVVRVNLKNAFPNYTDQQRLAIERKFYHFFCDYIVETIKLLSITDEEMDKRMKFTNVEPFVELMKEGNSYLAYLGHYGNWEWIPSITRHFKGTDAKLGQIYKQLSNKAVDDIFLKIRSRFGSFGIEKKQTLREIIKRKRANEVLMIGFMSDQIPSLPNIHYWSNFLGQHSAMFTGVERIAKQTGYQVVYFDVRRLKRGYYECRVELLSDNPKSEPEFAITEKYTRLMEQTILRAPECWLWTHKRWKYKNQEEVDKLLGKEENG